MKASWSLPSIGSLKSRKSLAKGPNEWTFCTLDALTVYAFGVTSLHIWPVNLRAWRHIEVELAHFQLKNVSPTSVVNQTQRELNCLDE